MSMLKLKPALKDNIWGGTRLKTDYKMETDMAIIAEAWVLSCHKAGPSVVMNGELAGLTLTDAIEKLGADVLGEKGKAFEFFPILIKLIDAKDDLSIQVHPSDEYALEVEKEYGKTEMWYVVDCDPGACLYYGFNRKVDKEEFAARIADNTITDVLNKVEVKPGDCFFIEAGTIHAIGSGILIAEIQQNSNTTYRVSDYGRLGADGKPRELHVDKAKEVTVLDVPEYPYGQIASENGVARLASCKYFTVDKLDVDGTAGISVDGDSFASLLCLNGEVEVANGDDKLTLLKGDCVFIPAASGDVTITGKADVIYSRV